MQVLSPLPPVNRCVELSRARQQQTDASVRCMKRKMFCASGRNVLSAKCLNKVAALHFLAKQRSLFVCLLVELNHLCPLGAAKELF